MADVSFPQGKTEFQRAHMFAAGEYAAHETILAFVREEAGRKFAMHYDDQAQSLRVLADELSRRTDESLVRLNLYEKKAKKRANQDTDK